MAVLNKCCCCCQLRTGMMVLGWFGLIMSMLDIAAVGGVYANRDTLIDNSNPFVKHALDTYTAMYITYCVMLMVIYMLLLWGANTGNRFLVLPWLVMEMLSLVTWTLVVVCAGIGILVSNSDVSYIGAIILGVGIPLLGLMLYLWLCVLSFFQELRDSQARDQNAMVELPGPLTTVITDYNPPEYSRLQSKDY